MEEACLRLVLNVERERGEWRLESTSRVQVKFNLLRRELVFDILTRKPSDVRHRYLFDKAAQELIELSCRE